MNGDTYPLSETSGGATVGAGFSGSFIAPAEAATAVVTTPFRFAGTVSVPADPARFDLIGSGTATVNLHFSSGNNSCCPDTWLIDSIRYEFSPVPEPGTLLMVGFGIVAAARRLRRHDG